MIQRNSDKSRVTIYWIWLKNRKANRVEELPTVFEKQNSPSHSSTKTPQ